MSGREPLLTRSGRAALAAGAALLVGGAITDWPDVGYVGLALLLGVAVALPLVWTRPRVAVTRTVEPVRVTVGQPSLGVLTIRNESARPVAAILAEERVGPDVVQVDVPPLGPGAESVRRYQLPTNRRAVLTVGPLMVVRRDPFGFARREQRRGRPETLWVHPRHHALRSLPSAFIRSTDGPTSDSAPQGTVSFHTIRDYVPGDDRRLIHWRTTARVGQLMVKQHVDTTLPDLTLLLDTRLDHVGEAEFEEAMEVAASLVSACTEHRYPLTIRTTCGQIFQVQRNEAPKQFFLDRLAGLERVRSGSLTHLIADLVLGRGGVNLVCVTSRPVEDDLAALVTLRARYRALVCVDVTGQPGRPEATTRTGLLVLEAATGADFADIWNRAVR